MATATKTPIHTFAHEKRDLFKSLFKSRQKWPAAELEFSEQGSDGAFTYCGPAGNFDICMHEAEQAITVTSHNAGPAGTVKPTDADWRRLIRLAEYGELRLDASESSEGTSEIHLFRADAPQERFRFPVPANKFADSPPSGWVLSEAYRR